jgi:hypothetical protein
MYLQTYHQLPLNFVGSNSTVFMFIFFLEGLQFLLLTSFTLFFQLLLLFPELLSGSNPTTAAANTLQLRFFNIHIGVITEYTIIKVAHNKYI